MRPGRPTPWVLLAALAWGGAGCASADESAAGSRVTFQLTARQNYEKGLAELKDENYPEASRYFSFVKQKFPFSKYAVLAELAQADTHFARGGYTEAVDAYKTFGRLHPTHEKVEDGYVGWKIAECYVKQMPDDWFLIPPSYEKDQSAVKDALREIDDFLDKFPDSGFVKDARLARREVLQRLVDHEVYVARFYLDLDKPKAATLRLEGALRRFPGSGREPELLLALGQTQLRMGRNHTARETFQRIVREHGDAYQARRAELYLAFIHGRFGDDPQDRAEAPPPTDNAPAPSPGPRHG